MHHSHVVRSISHTALSLLATVHLASCSGQGLEQEDLLAEASEEVARQHSAVTGGNLVTQDEFDDNNHFQATVRMSTSAGTCTATKLGEHHFLTAAHCVDSAVVGDRLHVTNQIDGNFNSPDAYTWLTFDGITIHPTWDGAVASDGADVAIFDVKEATPNIPAFEQEQFDTRVFPDGEWARSIGYGCDDTGSNDGQKQWADFQAYSRSSLHDSEEGEYRRSIVSFTPPVRVCPGDSGGPLIQTRGGHWRIVGVNSYYRRSDNKSGFARLSQLGDHFLSRTAPPDPAECIAQCNENCTSLQYDQIGQCQAGCPSACQ